MGARPANPAEERNNRLAHHAQEAMRAFVALKGDLDVSAVYFPDLVQDENLVDLLTGLRHWAGNCAMDYPKADRLARKRFQHELSEESPKPQEHIPK